MTSAPPEPPAEGDDTSDRELVARVQGGDMAAYDELIRRNQRKIYQLVYHMTANREDAEDLTQDVFVKAYKVLSQFKGDSSFYTWVYRIAVNQTINYLKKRNRRSAISLDDLDQAVERDPGYVELRARESTVRDVTLSELQKKLNEALQTLSEKHRTVAVLHDIQGIPKEEIGKMIGCSEGTVKSRLFYARRELQKQLSEFVK